MNHINETKLLDFKNSLHAVGKFIWETSPKTVLIAASGALLQIIYPVMAPPFHAITVGSTLSRLAVKVIDIYNRDTVIKINRNVGAFNKMYSKWNIVAFIVAIAAIRFSLLLSLALGLAFGIYRGLLATKMIRTYEQNALRHGQPLTPETLLLTR